MNTVKSYQLVLNLIVLKQTETEHIQFIFNTLHLYFFLKLFLKTKGGINELFYTHAFIKS